jgi:hypothetical protein
MLSFCFHPSWPFPETSENTSYGQHALSISIVDAKLLFGVKRESRSPRIEKSSDRVASCPSTYSEIDKLGGTKISLPNRRQTDVELALRDTTFCVGVLHGTLEFAAGGQKIGEKLTFFPTSRDSRGCILQRFGFPSSEPRGHERSLGRSCLLCRDWNHKWRGCRSLLASA